MANVSIQDIESVDDYWGPTFRSILEGTDQASLCEQIDARIRNHDKDIERICNIYYQGFIESIRELLQVRTQTKNLNNEVLSLNESLAEVSSGLLTRGKELVRARQVEGNIANAIQSLTNCLPVLECFSKLQRQVNEKRYYPALKTLELLESEHLPKVANYRFTAQMRSAVPKLKQKIKQSSEEDFREFLENIRKFSPKIGEVAMNHTRQMQRRTLKSIIEEYQSMEKNGGAADEEDLSAQDLIDFSPVYRCLHIYTVLNDKEYFENDWRKQRRDQAKLVLQAPQTMHDNLDAYKTYIHSIVGFFIVEDHVMNTGGEIVTRSYLDDLWSSSLTRAVNVLSMSSSSCTDPNILLRIKNLIMLSITTLKTYGYTCTQLWDLLLEMRDHYNEVLLQRWVNEFREILARGDFLPLEVEDQEEYDAILERFPFHSEQLESQEFPKKFPFSQMVPEVYHQAKEFMYACMKFSEELSLSPNEVAAMVRKAANLLLTRSFSGCLSAVFHSPSLALMQVIQIIIDTQYLEKAGPFLDNFVCKMTGTKQNISQAPSAMFHVARAEAEMQVSEKLCSKLDEFFEELEGYDWLLAEPIGHGSPFITDMIAFLQSTFQSFSSLLPNVAQGACKKACEHIANAIRNLLLSEDVKQISTGALQQISLDLMQCEVFAVSDPVPGLKEGELIKYFAELRQLLDLLLSEEWSAYLHDYGKDEKRYSLVQPTTIIIILEKIREADKKTMFSVLKKSERDKKKLLETVLKQLKQLAEKQN
ncbi:exocyst complex component 6 [Lutzomyia longipalpis]|uniref:exocyst complex component 6 n=1 Tax=Lutzomyia longipalpis TaxID=7200 RepID=UPI0024836AE6|nr:exocyst complex component 6 [Lutzomyia longipalpis]XP_055677116.1 exocyst complex component 6 [Lutzomyia longipalpis]XP_055677117.1 exocyst complex component 6 [Lutzomyia longipalpis]